VGEHEAEDRDAEHAADLAERRRDAGGPPGLARRHRGQHRRAQRGEEDRVAGARDSQSEGKRGVAEVGLDRDTEHAKSGGHQRQGDDQQRTGADTVGEPAARPGQQRRHHRDRKQSHAGAERTGTVAELKQAGEQEQRAEHGGVHHQSRHRGMGEGAVEEQAHRQHRCLGPALPRDEEAERGQPGGERDQLTG
jgi:hypothetical protein